MAVNITYNLTKINVDKYMLGISKRNAVNIGIKILLLFLVHIV